MKKLFVLLSVVIASFTFVSCDFLNSTTVLDTTDRNTTTAGTTEMTTTEIITTANVSTTQVITLQTTTTEATTTETTTIESTTTQTTTLEPVTTQTTETPLYLFKPTGYSLLQDELDYVGIPSIGSPKVLVFAVDFSDYTSAEYGLPISDIETVFNGEKGDMEFESLNSFYLESSYGKLDLTADVYGYYRASQSAEYYEDEFTKLWATNPITGEYLYDDDEVTYPESDLIYEILDYYDGEIDYSDYDYNNDGFIDGIYIVYTHPVSYSFGSDLWWAYQDIYVYEGDLFDGVEPLYFCWSGTEFMTEDDPLNARTIIHESGHMMGLDDYYDYDNSDNYNEGGLAGADMMDSAYGDHGAFSKLLLGWITPIVVEGNITIDILPFVNNGDVILVIDEWNDTIFDEYFLITLYTPTGLYEEDAFVYFTLSGVMIYHVSAEIGNGFIEDSAYWTIFNNNNTDTQNKVVKYLEADNDHSVENTEYTENSDLFQEGDIFGDGVYSNYQWYDGTDVGFDIKIDLVSLTTAEITIIFE
ncbi:MAG: M6 family metalloprotease domain-containing protein [Tenericutes bacterium]|nr:M6 family metalloprotease domain-containing protein [Mycoplasmatota bacterium]